jgi:tetratricopeptide (TPR) repeat protein
MIVRDPSSSHLQPILESLQNAYADRRLTHAAPASCLLLDRHGFQVAQLLASLEEHVRANGGEVLSGTWREGLQRPFGGLLDVVDDLAGRMLKLHPELLSRYGRTLITLLPTWHAAAQPLRRLREIRSGLADFILHGDQGGLDEYYRKRNLAPLVTADLVHFTLDASVALSERCGAPTVLILQDVQFADPLTITALELLDRYARKVPLLICATARDIAESDNPQAIDNSEPLRAWRTFSTAEPANAPDDENSLLKDKARLSPVQFELLQAASVLVLPFDKATWLRLAPEHLRPSAEDALENLVETHLLRRVGDERFTFSYAKLREDIYRSLSPECRRKHHTLALSAEAVDPFASTWHADLAGLPSELGQHSLQAMERAWGVSAYECAVALAEHATGAANIPEGVDGDVLMALLHYEAGRYIEAERFLLGALEKERHQKIDRTTLERLLGYNAIFGLNDFERGRTILELVLKKYEESGREKDAGYVRNAMAFALLRTRRFDEALEIENLTLGLIENSAEQDGFLFSLLQLNLARLYRTLGESEQALELFKKGMAVQNSDLSPYILLIFYGSLGYLHIAREDYAAALDAYHHCLELSRDLELGNINDQLLDLLTRQFGSPLMKRATRGDQAFSSLYTNLAWLYQKLGLNNRAAAYTDGLRSHWNFLGEEIWQTTEASLKTSDPAPASPDNIAADNTDGDEARQVQTHYMDLVHEAVDSKQLLDGIAEALEQKRTVAVVYRRSVGAQAQLVDSLVIYDPREAALAQRVNAEIGAASGPKARAGLLLPEAVSLFSGGLEPMPLVLQEASLKPEHRGWLKALLPYRVRMQVLSPDFDGFLFEILQAFARRTGVQVLAAAPFHLRGRDLSVTPEKALESYLVSSIDYLALGQQLLAKTHGATAAENLMPFHPRLSQHASIVDETAEQKETFLIKVRTWPSPNYLRLRREMRPLLNLCDGRRSVAEVASQLNPKGNDDSDDSHRIHNFLRDLWRHGAICFDAPVLQ